MDQLGLQIVAKLPYSADTFLLHDGIAPQYQECRAVLALPDAFRIAFFSGPPRSGKTHLSIRLADDCTQVGLFPRIIEGARFDEWAAQRLAHRTGDPGEVAIIDDAHLYLESLGSKDSGLVVAIVEHLRKQRAAMVFLSKLPIDELPLDDHARSRVVPGSGFRLGEPSERDIPTLLRAMARQRGITLSEKKVGYLEKRLPRDIAALDKYFSRVLHLSRTLGRSYKMGLLADAL